MAHPKRTKVNSSQSQFQKHSDEVLPKLTTRQERFVHEYMLNGGNGVDAAQKAGYSKDYRSAQVQAHRLLSNAIISDIITRQRAALQQKFEVTEERLIQELAAIAFFDLREVFEIHQTGVRLKDFSELPTNVTRAIARITETDSGKSRTIVAYDKLSAIEALVKCLGLFKEDQQSKRADKEAFKNAMERIRARFLTPEERNKTEKSS